MLGIVAGVSGKGKTLILVHGRNWKPARAVLRRLWVDALRAGFARDYPGVESPLRGARIEFVYHGDLSNEFLEEATGEKRPRDGASRRETLAALKKIGAKQFTKKRYEGLPGKSSFKEAMADVLGPVLSFFELGEEYIIAGAPDMAEYWNRGSDFGSRVRAPILGPLRRALSRGDSVAVVAHSLGSVIAYDTLWKFSHESEHIELWDAPVDLFLTLGSPLGDHTIQKNLRGANCKSRRCFPTNIEKWVNIAAEDDHIAHASRIAGDFRKMKKLGIVGSIADRKIYNLAVRAGVSNPHHSGGYLIHPATIGVLGKWLEE